MSDARLPGIGDLLLSARSLAEYRPMFDLNDDELSTLELLDCPGGAGSFGAEVRALGGTVVSVDPVYTESRDALVARAGADLERGNRYTASHAEHFVWRQFATPEAHAASRRVAIDRFGEDFGLGDRYVASALPQLPFADDRFDLSLCSHLLFTYADRLDLGFHRRSILELVRVARDGARVFPLIDSRGTRFERLDELRARLDADGVETTVVRVAYEFQRGGDEMLVCRGTAAAG